MKKKAELTTQQLVMIIVLLVSFVVLLLFLFKVNFQNTSEKEICQSSIQLSGRSSFFEKIDCKIHYLCISGGGECKGFTSRDTANINLDDKINAKKEVMKVLADEMADCWWMFGEGNVDYAKREVLSDAATCAVCTQFAFDEKLKESKMTSISNQEFYDFLKNTRKNEKQTYLEYMGISAPLAGPIDFNEKYSIYTGKFKEKVASWILPGINKDLSIPPIILKRDDSSTIKCASFITTP